MERSLEAVSIHVTLPKPWEQEVTFHDVLYEWLERAPWLALSALAHLLAFFVLMAVPWARFTRETPRVVRAHLAPTPEENFVPPPPEVLPETPREPEPTEPTLQDADLPDADTLDPAEDAREPAGDPDLLAASQFRDAGLADVIGIGATPGGKYGRRGSGGGPAGGRHGTEKSVRAGLAWLAAHQSPDGSWDCDGFAAQCGKLGATTCDGAGSPTHDVGVTGLALLAFLGEGSTSERGPWRETVSRGLRWLRAQQDPDTGLVGPSTSRDFVYDHAIATLALCENLIFEPSPLWRRTAQRAVGYVVRARDPYGAWRYDVPSIGDADTSVTGWMVFALAAARDAGLVVDPAALDGALAWIDAVTDPATGRVGYDRPGSLSSRNASNERFPRESGEAMTAVGLLSRVFLGQDPRTSEAIQKGAALLSAKPPARSTDGLGGDLYSWYYGTYALFQVGGSAWDAWEKALDPAVVDAQRGDGDAQGSWDPDGPWGYAGGRVYATALMALTLEVHDRYARLTGTH